MAAGYVYILLNPAMPDYLKIGRTARRSEDRAAELSASTGIPTRFHVAYEVLVSDSEAVERIVHQRLSKGRASVDREFFCVSLKEAISALADVALSFPAPDDEAEGQPTAVKEEASTPDLGPWQLVFEDGNCIVQSQVDRSSQAVRYCIRRNPPNRKKLLSGSSYDKTITKWVSPGVPFDAALSESLAASANGQGRRTHWDGFTGESGTYDEFSDGSSRGHGYEPNHLVRDWNSVANVTRVCDWTAALAIANTIIAEYSNESLGYQYKARALHKLKRTTEARTTLSPVINRFPSDFELAIELACYEWILGDLTNAKKTS